ncbi:FAD-dependent 5-carboxymethylaminomethyl-2-thiouridine(34) oxidoreductase MnmC [Psychrobacter sp. P11G5]|uniref:FAD-dependent 5-carboxymethylaminomethyl-2-thiouridine(34) oxidoreductase MnmC n=1 Tax=Psychrobacter sp. P11G5 TaxID=1699624 RepID=UPI00078D5D46|nr:FAD-dependent 5-carboxymethylaminomethyl-2-thiouridine(34) oxidoreductase MnmC [Psychrobacter sp. P11G5]AMN68214.1 FAD-dependent cmnm(5)s(2)U34 oxidoreductase [Psychrobacter sp. P11G5]
MPTAQIKNAEPSNVITPANIDWQMDDTGNMVPVSGEFEDVYFSHADGLAESRHVFLAHNQLPERLANLEPKQCFTIAELGFGTGLNLLATWQLWRQLRETHPQLATAKLHFITTEKFPIPLADLTQILALWGQRAPELTEIIELFLSAYPPLIAGCHRLHFFNDNLTVDIWLGDAAISLAKLALDTSIKPAPYIDAWFLDGFAPSCNSTLWAKNIFAQIQRLSRPKTTAATYSCAGIVKRALQNCGFEIEKVKGFGRKREMLTAVMADKVYSNDSDSSSTLSSAHNHIVVIGAGVSGLLTAWSLANHGINVTLLDKSAPLAGASGNPRALLAPKMTPIHHVDEHLHTIGYLYSSRLYRKLNEKAAKQNTAPVLEPTGALDLLMKANIGTEQILDYPDDMATTLSLAQAKETTGLKTQDLSENLYLPQSGLVNPQALKNTILTHPLIRFQHLEVSSINEMESHVCIEGSNQDKDIISIIADNVVICAAFESHQLDKRIFDCRKIRGQLSWFIPSATQWAKLPKLPLKYGGYCTSFSGQAGDSKLNEVVEGEQYLLLGASFVRNDTDTGIRNEEHQISREKLVTAIPEMESVIPTDTSLWQGRAGIRTQTPDYHPMVGQLVDSKRIWTMSAMGAKGYALAPICAETLADMMLGSFAPLSAAMLARLSPNRTRLQTPLT